MYHSDQSVTYQYWEFPVPGFFSFFWWYWKNLALEKVSELLSEIFGTVKSFGTSTKNETLIFDAKIWESEDL